MCRILGVREQVFGGVGGRVRRRIGRRETRAAADAADRGAVPDALVRGHQDEQNAPQLGRQNRLDAVGADGGRLREPLASFAALPLRVRESS